MDEMAEQNVSGSKLGVDRPGLYAQRVVEEVNRLSWQVELGVFTRVVGATSFVVEMVVGREMKDPVGK